MKTKSIYKVIGLWLFLFFYGSCNFPSSKHHEPYNTSLVLLEGAPGTVGMSSDRLLRIDTFFNKAIQDGWLPGAVIIVARQGKIVYYKSMGMDDIGQHKALRKDAIFRLASMTKALVSVGVMALYEEGHFVLDDPISKFISAFKNPQLLKSFNQEDTTYTTQPAAREITIRDLLRHTSGIGYGSYDNRLSAIYAKEEIPLFGCSDIGTIAGVIQKLGTLPLEHNPGEKFTYGLNTDVLGYLIEVVSKKPLATFLRERITLPLGMDDTYFHLPVEKANRLVKIYSEVKPNKLVELTNKTDTDWPNAQHYPITCSDSGFYSGGSGMTGTAKDYAIFLQMLLNGGVYNGHRIISRKTVDLMGINQIENISTGELGQHVFGTTGFGLGFSVVTHSSYGKRLTSVGRLGWGGYFNTMFWFDPKEELLAVMMTQVSPTLHNELDETFETLTYQSLE